MEILGIQKTSKNLLVTTYHGSIVVDRADFDEWVEDEQKREWMQVYADHNGEPVENEGTLPWEEYYLSKDFYRDVSEYITLKQLKYAG